MKCDRRKIRARETWRLARDLLVLTLLFILASLTANAADTPKSVFVKANCLGNISSTVLASLKEEIGNSQKYRLSRTLADEGGTDVVLTINMHCVERNGVVAVAIAFGRAKCFSATNCHLAVDGSSIRSELCDANAAECGRTLFKAFNLYMSNPLAPPLKLQ
jgi:hypothetical protein